MTQSEVHPTVILPNIGGTPIVDPETLKLAAQLRKELGATVHTGAEMNELLLREQQGPTNESAGSENPASA